MHQLSADPTFHFELLRLLGHTAYNGADVSECLVAAGEIVPGDFESWYAAWNRRAERILSQVGSLKDPISIRDSYFRASTYSRAADSSSTATRTIRASPHCGSSRRNVLTRPSRYSRTRDTGSASKRMDLVCRLSCFQLERRAMLRNDLH